MPRAYLRLSFSKRIVLSMSNHCPMNSCKFLHECGKTMGYLVFKFSKREIPTLICKFYLFIKDIGNGKSIIMKDTIGIRSTFSMMEESGEQGVSPVKGGAYRVKEECNPHYQRSFTNSIILSSHHEIHPAAVNHMKFIQGAMFDECAICSNLHLQSEVIKKMSLGGLRSDQVRSYELAVEDHRWLLPYLLSVSFGGSCEMGDILVEGTQDLHEHCVSTLT